MPAPAQAQGNEQAAEGAEDDEAQDEAPSDPIQELAKRLRRKRRPLPLTSTSLAARIGLRRTNWTQRCMASRYHPKR